MNSKLLNHEEGKIKIDNIKNITLSDIINKKKRFHGFRDGREFHLFNQISKNQNTRINKNILQNKKEFEDTKSRMNTKQINKNAKIAKLSLDLVTEKPYKLKDDLYKKVRRKNILSNRKFYPKKYLKMISFLTETNYGNKKKKRAHSFNKNKKEQMIVFKKVLNERKGKSVFNSGIPLMTFEKSKRKKKFCNKTLKEKNIKKINDISNNKNQNISFNQRGNCPNNNISSKPQCLYKGPLKYDMSIGEDDDIPQNNHSLFKTFMSRNLKPAKPELNNHNHLMEFSNKDFQACTFIKYDVNGTMRTKRIFNSTFHIIENSKNENINKEILTTINNNNNLGVSGKNNKKKRTFGGIMMGNKAKLF